MPVDASIYAQIPLKGFATLGEIVKARQEREDADLNRQITKFKLSEAERQATESARVSAQAQQEQQAMREAFSQFTTNDGPDEQAIVNYLYQKAPTAAPKVQEQFAKVREQAAKARTSELDNQNKASTQIAQWLQAVTPENAAQTYTPVWSRINAMDPEMGQFLSPQYDPQKVTVAAAAGTARKEYNDQLKDIIQSNKDATAKALEMFAIAQDPQHWADAMDYAKLHGVAADLRAQGFSEMFDPAGPQRAADLVLGTKERATLAGQQEGRDLTRRGQDMSAATAAANRAVTVRGQNMTDARARATAAAGGSSGGTRPVTSGDANRLADITDSLNSLEQLKKALRETKDSTGTAAKVGASLPNFITNAVGWGRDAKSRQAVIDRVKQVIGKGLEGGVLRKEDEVKYEKILPTIYDNEQVAEAKLSGLDQALHEKYDTHLSAMEDAGYNTTRFRARQQGGTAKADPMGIR